MSDEEEDHIEGEMPWSEMDEIGFRRSLRVRLSSLPDMDTHEQRMGVLSQMVDIVREEIAHMLPREIYERTSGQDTGAEAMEAAEEVNRDLARLGLALKHPLTGVPSRFGIATTRQPDKRWFQIEPLSSTDRSPPYPVPSYSRDPKDQWAVMPAPLDEMMQGRGRGRN